MSDYSLGGLLACCRLFVLFPRVMIKACNENNKNISVEITQIQSKKEKKKMKMRKVTSHVLMTGGLHYFNI